MATSNGYDMTEIDYAVLIAKAALLNAEVEGMKQANHDRRSHDYADAYTETDFYTVSLDLKEQLERCKIGEDIPW